MLLNEIIKKENGGYVIYNHTGKKKLSRVYETEEEAKKRLKQIEFFKHIGGYK